MKKRELRTLKWRVWQLENPDPFLPTFPELLDQLESLELKIRELERRVQELREESRILRGNPVE